MIRSQSGESPTNALARTICLPHIGVIHVRMAVLQELTVLLSFADHVYSLGVKQGIEIGEMQ